MSIQGTGPRHFFLAPCGTGKAHKPEGKQEEPLSVALLLNVMDLRRDALGFHAAGFHPLETGVNSL